MVTAILKDDEIFKDLAPESEWEKVASDEAFAIGSLTETEDGYGASGVMIYSMRSLQDDDGAGTYPYSIDVSWVYVSLIVQHEDSVYNELFDEAEAVAKRNNIRRVALEIPVTDNYYYEELASFLEKRKYMLTPGRDDFINAFRWLL